MFPAATAGHPPVWAPCSPGRSRATLQPRGRAQRHPGQLSELALAQAQFSAAPGDEVPEPGQGRISVIAAGRRVFTRTAFDIAIHTTK